MGNQLLVSAGSAVKLAQTQVAMAVTPAADDGSLGFKTTGDIESDLSEDRVSYYILLK